MQCNSGPSIFGVWSTVLCLERQLPVASLICFVVYVGVRNSIQKYKNMLVHKLGPNSYYSLNNLGFDFVPRFVYVSASKNDHI